MTLLNTRTVFRSVSMEREKKSLKNKHKDQKNFKPKLISHPILSIRTTNNFPDISSDMTYSNQRVLFTFPHIRITVNSLYTNYCLYIYVYLVNIIYLYYLWPIPRTSCVRVNMSLPTMIYCSIYYTWQHQLVFSVWKLILYEMDLRSINL